MPQFIDTLLAAPWALKASNGGYVGFNPGEVDPSGAPYATTFPSRSAAALFTFAKVQEVSPTNALVTLSASGTQRYLGVNSAQAVVFGAVGGSPVNFNALAVRANQLQLGQNITGPGGAIVNFSSASGRFSLVTGASGPDARFGLAPPLPQGAVIWASRAASPVVGTPYIYGGGVFAAGAGVLLTSFDQLGGSIVWEAGEGLSASSPVEINYAHRKAYVGDTAGLVHAIAIDTGVESWTFQASAPVYARPSAYVEQLFVPSSDGVLYGLSTDTGVQAWRYPATGNLAGIFTSPVMAGQTVFFGAWDQSLHAVNAANGQSLWTYAAGSNVNGGIEADTANIYFGTDGNQVVALRQSDGAELWLYPTNGIVSGAPVAVGGNLYFGSVAGDFACVATATGVAVWQVHIGAPIASAPQYADGVVYFNTMSGGVYALNAATGATLATYQAGAATGASAIELSGVIYVAAGAQVQCLAASLAQTFVPTDLTALLMLASWTNAPNGQAPTFPGLPGGWTNTLAVASGQPQTFGTAGVTTLTLPGTDEAVTAISFGTDPEAFLIYIDTSPAGLAALPATIAGSSAPAGLQVNAAVLASYQAMRAQILSAVTQAGGGKVRVTGLGAGGSLATLAALDLSVTAGKPGMPTLTELELVTFGAPALGNQAFATFFGQSVSTTTVIVNVTDTMPALLPASSGYVATGQPCTIGAVGVTTSPTVDPSSFKAYRVSLIGR